MTFLDALTGPTPLDRIAGLSIASPDPLRPVPPWPEPDPCAWSDLGDLAHATHARLDALGIAWTTDDYIAAASLAHADPSALDRITARPGARLAWSLAPRPVEPAQLALTW